MAEMIIVTVVMMVAVVVVVPTVIAAAAIVTITCSINRANVHTLTNKRNLFEINIFIFFIKSFLRCSSCG